MTETGTCRSCGTTGIPDARPDDGTPRVCAACQRTQNQTASEQPHLFAFPTGIRGQLTLEG